MFSRWIRACALTAVAALLLAGAASAHAFLVRTDPADGATLSQAPRQVRLWFSEPVLFNFTSFEMTDSRGQATALTRFHLDSQDQAEIVIDLPALKPDAYRLIWKTASSDDLHTSTGSLVFGVQQAAEMAAAVDAIPAPSPIEVLLRWLNFGALAGLVGALIVAFLLLPLALRTSQVQIDHQHRALSHRLRRRLLKLALSACLLAMAAGVSLLLAQVAAAGRITLDNLQQVITQTSYGTYGLMREGWLIALVGVIVLRLRDRVDDAGSSSDTDRLTLLAILPLVLALATMQALTGHAAAFNAVSIIRVGVDVLHLLGASVWAGGLLALAITLAPLLRRGPVEKALAGSILQRFGLLAAASLAVLCVTGLYSSGQQVASLDALLTTSYGQSLLLKIGLVLGVGLIGLINSSLLHPRVADVLRRVLHRPIGWTLLDRQRLGRSVLIESIGAAAILLFAAWLSAAPPARGPQFEPPIDEQTAAVAPTQDALTQNVADLVLTLSVKPNRPGQNFVSVGVFNTRRPAPAPIDRVAVKLAPPDGQRSPIELAAVRQADGVYQVGGSVIDAAGDWRISVIVSRPGMPDAALTVPWTVMPASQPIRSRPVVFSNSPLAPGLTLAAAIISLILLGTVVALGVRRLWDQATLARLLVAKRPLHPLQKE